MRLRLAILATVLLCCAPAALHAASLSYHRLDASIAYAFAPSANNQPRVLVIGDKLVEDGTKQNNGWVSQLKGAYGDAVELYSLGSNLAHTEAADGALASLLASPQGKAAFSKVVLVVLAFGSNEVNAAHSKTNAPWVSPKAFEQHLGSMVRQLQAQKVEKLILVQPPPLKDFTEAQPYAQAVADVANTYQVPFVDIMAAISKTPAWKTQAFSSNGQLAQMGHDILFGRIGTEIKRQLPTVSPQALAQRSKQTSSSPAAPATAAAAAVATAAAAAGSDTAADTAAILSHRGGRARPAAAMKHRVHTAAGRVRRQHRGPAAASANKAAAAAYRQQGQSPDPEQQMQPVYAAEAEQHMQHMQQFDPSRDVLPQMEQMQQTAVTAQAAEPGMKKAPLQRAQGVRLNYAHPLEGDSQQAAATLSSVSSSSSSSSEPAGKWDSLDFVSKAMEDELDHVPLKTPAAKPHDSASSMLAADTTTPQQQQQPAATAAVTTADDSWRSKVPEPAVDAAPAWFAEVPEPKAAKAAALMVLPEPHLTTLAKPSDPSLAAATILSVAPDAVPAAAAAAPTWAANVPEPTASAPSWQAAVPEPGQAKLMVQPEAHLASTAKAAATAAAAAKAPTDKPAPAAATPAAKSAAEPVAAATPAADKSASEPIAADAAAAKPATAAATEPAAPWYSQVPEPSDSGPTWQAAVAEPNPAKHAALMAIRGADQAPEEETATPRPLGPPTPSAADTWGRHVPEPTATLPTWFAAVPEPHRAGADSTAEEPAAAEAPKPTEPAASQEQQEEEEQVHEEPAAAEAPKSAEPAAGQEQQKEEQAQEKQEPAAIDAPKDGVKGAQEPAEAEEETPKAADQELSTADKPAEHKAADQPAEQKPAADKPAAVDDAPKIADKEPTAADKPAAAVDAPKPAAKEPTADQPTEQKPADKPAAAKAPEATAADKPAAAVDAPKPAAKEPTADKPAAAVDAPKSAEQQKPAAADSKPLNRKVGPVAGPIAEPEQDAPTLFAKLRPKLWKASPENQQAEEQEQQQELEADLALQEPAFTHTPDSGSKAAGDHPQAVMYPTAGKAAAEDSNSKAADSRTPTLPSADPNPAVRAVPKMPIADMQPAAAADSSTPVADMPVGPDRAQPVIPGGLKQGPTVAPKDAAQPAQPAIPTFGAPAVEPAKEPAAAKEPQQPAAGPALTTSSNQAPASLSLAPAANQDQQQDAADAAKAANPTFAPAAPAPAPAPAAATDPKAAADQPEGKKDTQEGVEVKPKEESKDQQAADAVQKGADAVQGSSADDEDHRDSGHSKGSKHSHVVVDKYGHNDPELENLDPKRAHKAKVSRGSKPEHPAHPQEAQQQQQQPQRRDPEEQLRDSAASAEEDTSKPLVVTLGDYVMSQGSFGTGIVTSSADASGWVARLAAAYGDTAQVVNRGQATATSPEGVEMVRELLKEYPDAGERIKLVVLSFGWNDAITRSGDNTGKMAKVAIADYKENIKTMVAELRKAGVANVLLVTPPPAAHRADRKFRTIKEYAKASSDAAKAMNVPTVELFNAVSTQKDWQASAMKADGLRLSERGQQLLFKRVMKVLSAKLPAVSPAKLRAVSMSQ